MTVSSFRWTWTQSRRSDDALRSGVGESEVNAHGAHLAPTKPVHEVAGKWVLTGRADGLIALGAGWQPMGKHVPGRAVVVANQAAAGGLQIARPTHIAVRMADVGVAA